MTLYAEKVLQRAAEALADPDKTSFTSAIMYSFLKNAYREIRDKMKTNGIPTSYKTSTTSVVTIGELDIDDPPADMLHPIKIYERLYGSTDRFVPMNECRWLPNRDQETELLDWTWQEDKVKFVGATTKRELKIEYQAQIADLTESPADYGTVVVGVPEAEDFLIHSTAAQAAALYSEDYERAKALQVKAENAKNGFIAMAVKRKQGMPGRRVGYGHSRRFRRVR